MGGGGDHERRETRKKEVGVVHAGRSPTIQPFIETKLFKVYLSCLLCISMFVLPVKVMWKALLINFINILLLKKEIFSCGILLYFVDGSLG